MLELDIDYRPQCVAHALQVREFHSMLGRGARTSTFLGLGIYNPLTTAPVPLVASSYIGNLVVVHIPIRSPYLAPLIMRWPFVQRLHRVPQ